MTNIIGIISPRSFGIKNFSSDSCLRKVLDKIDWKVLRNVFKKQFDQLIELGIVKTYEYLGGYTLVSNTN